MRVELSRGLTGTPVRLVRQDGEHVVLVEDRAYTRAEVAQNVMYLNSVLRDFRHPDSLRDCPLNYRELAEALGVSVKWLQRRVRAGLIPHYRVGVSVRFEPGTVSYVRDAIRRGRMTLTPPKGEQCG